MATREGESVGQKLHEFAANSTVHGVSHTADVQRSALRRVVWFLLLLGFSVYFVYVASNRIIKYYSHPVGTRISIIDKRPTEFPAVTICNMNLLRMTYVQEDDFLMNVMLALKRDAQSAVDISDPEVRSKFDETYNVGEVFQNGAHQPKDTVRACSWGGEKDVCYLYMSAYSTQMGHCFTFNSHDYVMQNGSLVTSRIGIEGGLQLTLNVQQEEYFYQDRKHEAAGFKVLIHHPSTWPLMSDLGIAISPGTETYLAVEAVAVERLAGDFGKRDPCISTKDPSFVNPLEFLDKYSKEGCFYNCLAKYVIHERGCKCRPWNLHAKAFPDCTLTEYMQCVNRAEVDFTRNQTVLDSCKCANTCQEVYYRVSKSEALYPSDLAMKKLAEKHGISETYFRKNIIELKIYFEALSYELIEEYEAYTMGDLQADIGGNLGLCLGASFLSLAEFGEILLLLLTTMAKKFLRTEARTMNTQ
ncbi:hypothetical protein CAPTEDRAFT_191757 [Capitella teleta]|uniref:Uncharacterized protein n=1 Tax=Capitella teleta TaxID=283909 RepID=R7TY86_CAPTE|nr:hypothetical protein CAPTEDRAFT_191757 [Capitella teleta]|eukprot:ELT98709.1 hypothetical protein CAPTEDRAFT_191757 [Capitella teleta]